MLLRATAPTAFICCHQRPMPAVVCPYFICTTDILVSCSWVAVIACHWHMVRGHHGGTPAQALPGSS